MNIDDRLDNLEWGDPPPPTERSHITRDFVAELKRRPGEWAKYPRTLANQHQAHYERTYWGTEWEFRLRDDGRYDAWARWVR
ncbi:MAG: hypothetical protein KDH16_22870 [Rhodocyclaceae bacterium]|nr:hypothetical protein [Rhodocyclaceae bacterium]